MPIRNVTKGTTLAETFELATTFFDKFLGLMFSSPTNQALVFVYGGEKTLSLHMFFVFYPIDVVWLSSDKRVVYLKPHFKPFTVCVPPVKAQYVIEAPDGAILQAQTAIGDQIEFER